MWKETLDLAKEAGVTKEKFCEFAKLSRRITVDNRIIDILQEAGGAPSSETAADATEKSVIEQINFINATNQRRVDQLRIEINKAFRLKGLPEMSW
jgi:hypothetical protein